MASARRSVSPGNLIPESLLLLVDLLAEPLLLFAQLGRELGAEILCLEHRTKLDLADARMRIRAALEPLHGLFHRRDPPQPEARDELLRLDERAVDQIGRASC